MKKRKYLFLILFIISIGCFSISIYKIFKWKKDDVKIEEETKEIYEENPVEEKEDSSNVTIVGGDVKKEDPYWDYIKMSLIDVDFKDLKMKNNETKGWIQVKGTNINYPFVQTTNNDFYLNHSFDKSKNEAGWIFMDYRNKNLENEKNIILYGHGRINKVMFGSLRNIVTSNWYNDVNNHVIKLSTESENSIWQVFSVYHIETTNDYIQTSFKTSNEYQDFLNKLKNRSVFTFNTDVKDTDRILTLSTCYNEKEKVVLHAKLIKKEKK